MKFDRTQDEGNRVIVLLDGRPVVTALAADDEEGWVEVPDLARMAPIDPDVARNEKASDDPVGPGADYEVSEWEEIPILRKHGRVEIKKI